MADVVRRITEPGYYDRVIINGNYDDKERNGLEIKSHGTVFINELYIDCVKVPIIFRNADRVIVNYARLSNYWGDGQNVRSSHYKVDILDLFNPIKRYDYENYHQDTFLQAYAMMKDNSGLDINGVIEDVVINEITLHSDLEEVNFGMLSEFCKYKKFLIGNRKLDLKINSHRWLNANNLSESVIGGGDVNIRGFNPSIRPSIIIEDRPKLLKGEKVKRCSGVISENNSFINIPNMELSNICGHYETY